MPYEMPSDAELVEQLTLHVEQLNAQKEQLEKQLADSQELLARSESHNTQLTSIIDASAEDLQPFGSAWLKPSSVQSITYQYQGGIHIDGISIETQNRAPTAQIAAEMKSFAERINTLNAQRRKKAKR